MTLDLYRFIKVIISISFTSNSFYQSKKHHATEVVVIIKYTDVLFF